MCTQQSSTGSTRACWRAQIPDVSSRTILAVKPGGKNRRTASASEDAYSCAIHWATSPASGKNKASESTCWMGSKRAPVSLGSSVSSTARTYPTAGRRPNSTTTQQPGTTEASRRAGTVYVKGAASALVFTSTATRANGMEPRARNPDGRRLHAAHRPCWWPPR